MSKETIEDLISILKNGDTNLAIRCRNDSAFYKTTQKYIRTLNKYYSQISPDGSYLELFRRKLRGWIKKTPDAYIGFWGELQVAHWLCEHKQPHNFIGEIKGKKSPDIAMKINNQDIYLEVKTIKEGEYEWFSEKVLKGIKSYLPNRGIQINELRFIDNNIDDLINIAIEQILKSFEENTYINIEYEYQDPEGNFSFFLPKNGGFISSWPDGRVRKDGTPWLEAQLNHILEKNLGQFKKMSPTFLVWVSFDKLLPSFSTHVENVLCQHGYDYPDVAGVIILEPFAEWFISCNTSYSGYNNLKRSGVFNGLMDIKNH